MDLLTSSAKASHDESNLIWVTDFTESSAQKFSEKVLKIAANDENQPIVVYVDSYGGYMDALAAMVSTMDSVPNKFVTVATGKAMSAGAILLSHGDLRCVGRHARIMIHEASAGTQGNVNDMSTDMEEIKRLNRYFLDLLAKNCNKKVSDLKKMWATHRDKFLTPNQAVRFGIADKVGIPIVEQQTTYNVKFIQFATP